MQLDPDPVDHDLPITLMMNYSGDVTVHANGVNGSETLPIDMRPFIRIISFNLMSSYGSYIS